MFEILWNSFLFRRSHSSFSFRLGKCPSLLRCILFRIWMISCATLSNSDFFYVEFIFLFAVFAVAPGPCIFGPLVGDAREKLIAWSRHFEWETRFALTVILRRSFRLPLAVAYRHVSVVASLSPRVLALTLCRPFYPPTFRSGQDILLRQWGISTVKYFQYICIDGPFLYNQNRNYN